MSGGDSLRQIWPTSSVSGADSLRQGQRIQASADMALGTYSLSAGALGVVQFVINSGHVCVAWQGIPGPRWLLREDLVDIATVESETGDEDEEAFGCPLCLISSAPCIYCADEALVATTCERRIERRASAARPSIASYRLDGAEGTPGDADMPVDMSCDDAPWVDIDPGVMVGVDAPAGLSVRASIAEHLRGPEATSFADPEDAWWSMSDGKVAQLVQRSAPVGSPKKLVRPVPTPLFSSRLDLEEEDDVHDSVSQSCGEENLDDPEDLWWEMSDAKIAHMMDGPAAAQTARATVPLLQLSTLRRSGACALSDRTLARLAAGGARK